MPVNFNEINNLGDFATLIKWDLVVLRAPSAVNITDELNTRCLSTDVPKNEASQSADINLRGFRIRQPGQHKSQDTITLTFAEGVNNAIAATMAQWKLATFNPETGLANRMDEVKGDFAIIRRDRQDNAIWQYTMKGVYLEDYDPVGGQLDGENADIMRPTMTLSMDVVTEGPAT